MKLLIAMGKLPAIEHGERLDVKLRQERHILNVSELSIEFAIFRGAACHQGWSGLCGDYLGQTFT